MTTADLQDLADDVQPDLETRNAVWTFVRTAPRKVRRAVIHGTVAIADTTWKGVKAVANGAWAALPHLLAIAGSLAITTLIIGGVWFNAMIVNAVMAVYPIVGLLLMLIFAVELAAISVRTVGKFISNTSTAFAF